MIPKNRLPRLLQIGSALLALLAITLSCSLFTAQGTPPPSASPSVPSSDTPAPTITPQPTETPLPTQTETPEPAATEAPVEGQEQAPDYEYREDFDFPPDNWEMGERSDPVAEISFLLEDRKYLWQAEAFEDMAWLQIADPDVPLPDSDYLYSALIEMSSDQNDELAAGLLFNCQDLDNLYFAQLSSSGELAVYLLLDNRWETLVKAQPAEGFVSGEENRLTVIKRAGAYEVQINETTAAVFNDDRLQGGTIGLAIELQAGERGAFLFDDLRLSAAGDAAAFEGKPRPTIIPMGASMEVYEGQAGGVSYMGSYPRSFIEHPATEGQQFCLNAPEELCLYVRTLESFEGDEAALAEQVMAEFSTVVDDYTELHRQSTQTIDGLPAAFVNYTYSRQGQPIEGARLFVTARGIGFDLAVEGEPVMVDVYRTIINNMLESFMILE